MLMSQICIRQLTLVEAENYHSLLPQLTPIEVVGVIWETFIAEIAVSR